MTKLRLGQQALTAALEAARARVKQLELKNFSLRSNLKRMKATNQKYKAAIKAFRMEMSDE